MGPPGDTLPRRRVPSKGLVNSEGRRRESPRRGQSPVPCARRLRRDGRPAGLGRAFFFARLQPEGSCGGGRARAGASRPCLAPVACVGTAGRPVSAGLFFSPNFPCSSAGSPPPPWARAGARRLAGLLALLSPRGSGPAWRLAVAPPNPTGRPAASPASEPKTKGCSPRRRARAPAHGYP